MTSTEPNLRGIFAPITTPFGEDETLDLAALAANIEKYNRTGMAGYVVVGSTGESVYLSETEKLKAWETARKAAAPEKTLIAGTGCEGTAATIALTRRAAELGCHAVLVRTPSYFKAQMTDQVQERHFRAVADVSPVPVLLYSVPQFTGLALEGPLVAKLAQHPNIIGIKESSGHLTRVADILRLVPPGFHVLNGSATTLYPALCLGAGGAILAIACALPELSVELYESFRRGDHQQARELQKRLHEPTVAVTSRYGIAGLKFALELRGYAGGRPRPPLLPLQAGAREEISRIFRSLEASK